MVTLWANSVVMDIQEQTKAMLGDLFYCDKVLNDKSPH